MSTVAIAKKPDLTFLTTSKRKNEVNACPLPLILKKDGRFDWDANSYLTDYGGGAKIFNITPLATTVEKKAYSLNLFCTFIEGCQIKLSEIDDSTLYQYVEYLKERCVTDATIIIHLRTALDYIVHLTLKYPEWYLSTDKERSPHKYSVHYTIKIYKSGRIEKEYLYHRCLDGLINISTEAEFIHDYEYVKWLDAINTTTYHPKLNDLLVSRWQTLATLLEITGSRISEVHQITKTMIKKASRSLMDNTAKHVIRNIPINKGKYKGKTRQVQATKEDLQIILWHINLVQQEFPNMKHDAIFVDVNTGKQLKSSYLKNYAKKVINGSPYNRDLKHLSNHSFRHRFITLHVAKAIKKMSKYGSFSNILTVAANACRKLTMHASNVTLSHYVHLATDLNDYDELEDSDLYQTSTQISIRLKTMMKIAEQYRSNTISESETLKSILSTLDEFQKYGLNQGLK
tara:strand:- start:4478 stop:5851 length:1374 start_codon:yes stop_codon:yes gene_type:complete